ncbi:MAG: trypsin-like peptidase domain-containing protein, partial [Spirochaetales bacterium]|nr:trypsin-like peptidase domain-containing protein [Spirochaetales bacterium]
TGDPADDRFVHHINLKGPEYPETTQRLMENYAKKQRWLIGRYIENNDFFGARFYFNNLFAVSYPDDTEKQRFYEELLYLTHQNNLDAMEKYLRLSHGDKSYNTDFTGLNEVNNYNELLAEIYVDRTYEARNKLTRRDDPLSMGSGILVDPYHVLTAYHVIEHVFYENTLSYNISITLQDRTVNNVSIVAWDSLTDLVLLKTNESFTMEYPFYRLLGDSNTLKQGFEVYCLGHHEGLTGTLTKGIVSSPSRKAPEVGQWIQVDAAVAPGASGGMLIGKDNLIYGLLVAGVVYEDINFAIPSNIILSEIDKLMAGKNARRPWLGVKLKENEKKREVRIGYVFPASPLRDLNVRMEDILVSINGTRIDTIEKAQNIINSLETGNLVSLFFLKPDKTPLALYAILSRRPDYALYSGIWTSNEISSFFPYFGVALDNTKVTKRNLKVNDMKIDVPFYKVLKVENETFFYNMGVKIGDSIGILFNVYENLTRYIRVVHLPQDKSIKDLKNLSDYIYNVKKDKYDENIL